MTNMNNNEIRCRNAARRGMVYDKETGKPVYYRMSEENLKLQNNEETRWLIWNLPAVKTCPGATPDCIRFCYARKAEKARPCVLPSRERHLQESQAADFKWRMVATIQHHLDRRCFKNRDCIVRIHESGDFYSQAYADAWIWIARLFVGQPVKFLAYTKSFEFFRHRRLPENFSLRYSLDKSSSPEARAMAKGKPIYEALYTEDITALKAAGVKTAHCRCEDCATCRMCLHTEISHIHCEIH